MVITGDHVLGSEVDKWRYCGPVYGLNKVCVRTFYRVPERQGRD